MCKVPLKTKVLQYHLSGDLRRFQGDLVAQLLQAADRPALGSIVGLLFGMPWSQFTIGLLLMKQVIDDDQNAMGQSDDGFFMSHALAQSLVVGAQVGSLAPRGSTRRFYESLTQPSIPLACFRAQLFACTDLGKRTQTRPGDEMR